MHAPLYSTIALIAEIFISTVILYIFYFAYTQNRFRYWLVGFALVYEVLFNLSYMIFRTTVAEKIPILPVSILIFGAFHGFFSLIMFIALVIFFILAWYHYRKGINYFFLYKKTTITFVVLWLIAVLSGIGFYFLLYI